MELNYKDMIKALNAVEEERNIPIDIVKDALKEAMAKAYKKDAELSDIEVEAEINEETETIDLYQVYEVVDEVFDDELEISVEDAKEYKENPEVGDKIRIKKELTNMSRAAATLAKNVMRQKIREAEKVAIYDEYIGLLHEMVLGIVESVKEKFVLVNLGKTVALMPNSASIRNERIVEGQKLRVVITEVNKETKGSQVLVSRADPLLVKRLFEKEVPEIYQGTVEIKAIAREAGERTKMAVYSKNPEIDPIGACIGPRGQRVQGIIEELHGEKIDIFEWNEDLTELVRNALAPAAIDFVVPGEEENSLLVVVADDQLSLAIGKSGKNARLAVKLTEHKIDIKSRTEIEEMGLDYDTLAKEAEEKREEMRKEVERKEIERLEEEARVAEEKRLEAAKKLIEENATKTNLEEEEDDWIPEEMQEVVSDRVRNEIAMKPEDQEEAEEKETTEEVEVVEEEKKPAKKKTTKKVEEEAVTTAEEKDDGKKHADLEEMAAKNTYVSALEQLADGSSEKQSDSKPKKKKKKGEEEEYRVRNKDLEEQIKKNLENVDNRPVYTEEELAEIEADEIDEYEDDIDYDEYEEYYDDEDN